MKLTQSASAVWMIRPLVFYGNPETAATNKFQQSVSIASMSVVLQEFDTVVKVLRDAGVNVIITQCSDDKAPDAVFPNNWVSFHANGSVVIYPMMAVSRRREREVGIPIEITDQFSIRDIIDLTGPELESQFLEGTGSIVFDHLQRKAYAVRSERTNEAVLQTLCLKLEYAPVVFSALDKDGIPVYHTNVVMNVGDVFAMICSEAISDPEERRMVCTSLEASGRELIHIDQQQMHSFAGNMLQLCNSAQQKLLVMSVTAHSSLSEVQIAALEKYVRIIIVDIPTIEQQGGGSIRCMLAEIFLPLN
jgi:hypothetical protein